MSAGETPSSFGFTKDTEQIARRASFSNTLNDACAMVEKKPGSNGFLLKRSSTGQWNKRWFVIHGHYLSYYRKDPNTLAPSERIPLGALDLWHVLAVSLDESTITLQLSDQASEARKDEMGGELAKKLVNTASQFSLLSKSTFRRMDALRRQHIKPKFVVKCANATEAQQWLSLMRESPLLGSLGAFLLGAEPAAKNNQAAKIKELCFSFGNREIVFGDLTALFGDGVTELLLTNLSREHGECSVSLDNGTKSLGTPFSVPLSELAGSVEVDVNQGEHVVKITWARKPADWVLGVAMPTAAVAAAVFVAVLITTKFHFKLALLLCIVASAAFAGNKVQKMLKSNDILIRNVQLRSKDSSVPVSTLQPKSTAPAVKLGISTDKNISPEEAGQLEDLRARLKDMWQPNPKADDLLKKFDKFFREWHADLGALKNANKIKQVMDKHILVDFRLVRFLRARKHNVAKAEEMARDSLTWRVILGSDAFSEDKELQDVPQWLMDYFASPYMQRIMLTSENRLANLYQRDNDGHAAFFFRAGRINTRRIFKKCGSKICFMAKYLVACVEQMRVDLELLQEQTGVETVVSIIVDLEGFSVGEQMPIGDLVALARRFFPIFATGFPELLHRVLVFNAPWLFGTLWSAVKPFIPDEVQEKIQIHSGAINYSKHVAKYYDAEHIPKYFGGSKVDIEDGNEHCTNMLAVYAPYSVQNEGLDILEGVDPRAVAW